MRVFKALLITVLALGVIEASFLARTVKDAVELGSSLESQPIPSISKVIDLDETAVMRAHLVSVGKDIIGTPTQSTMALEDAGISAFSSDEIAPQAVPLMDVKPSLVETNSFTELLSKAEAEEAELVKKQEQEILADRAETSQLLEQFESMDKDVQNFDQVLSEEKISAKDIPDFHTSFADIAAEAENDKPQVRTVAEIEAEVQAEMVKEATERLTAEAAKSLAEVEASTKSKAETEVEAEAEAEAEADAEADAEAETEADADAEAEGEVEADAEGEEVAFAELGVMVNEQESSLESYLAKVDSPAPEQEILEPTFLEENEAIEAANGQDASMLSFLLTNEELTAELDHVAKQMQKQN